MANRKLAKAFKKLPRQLWKQYRLLTKAIATWLIRSLMVLKRRKRQVQTAGFVLPTTVLLLLVVSLTVAALVFRAYNNTTQTIGEQQQRVIYNAATPAIDRARAKIENLFDPNRDNRYPGGVPAESYLTGMLRNDGSYNVAKLGTDDQYTLPDETRIDLGAKKAGETTDLDNAWAFRADTDGDGTKDATVVYSILLQVPTDIASGGTVIPGSGVVKTDDQTKANNLWVRTAPLSNRQRGNCGVASTQAASAAQGWFEDLSSSAILRKNFQIDAMVIPDSATTRPNYVTLEMQHDRQLDRGNKWGAWFRNDLTIYPGADFSFNGAMHTEGSLMVRPNGGTTRLYLVSAENSCLMGSPTNSEITVTNIENKTNDTTKKPDFIGGVISGQVSGPNGASGYGGSSSVDVWPAKANNASKTIALSTTTDTANETKTPIQMSLDPVALLTRDVSLANDTNTSNRTAVANWEKGIPKDDAFPRIRNQVEPKPYVDDLYRADDRWGPKPRYSDQIVLKTAAQQPGNLITAGNVTKADDLTTLTNSTPVAGATDAANVGLDGYWERRARYEGMRIIVGQRLELGNSNGWKNSLTSDTAANRAKADPMYPVDATITHEQRQRRTLRDNLAAVQAAAIYHSGSTGSKDFPVACLANVSHPGTAATLRNSINFDPAQITGTYYDSAGAAIPVVTDFLNGRGTNGWEFAPPATDETAFATAIADSQPLGKALRNLAYMAGDYVDDTKHGAFPPTQIAGEVHPDPLVSMWGNFSELRRTLARLDGGTDYASLSIADKTNLHTAACTISMLAYNIDAARRADVAKTADSLGLTGGQQVSAGEAVWKNFKGQGAGATDQRSKYCVESPSNTYTCTLPQVQVVSTTDPLLQGLNDKQFKLAQVILTSQQIDRDRTYGFADNTVTNGGMSTLQFTASDGSETYKFQIPKSCDPRDTTNLSNPLVALTNAAGAATPGLDTKQAGLIMLCATKPRYPSLFYLFPKVDHDQDGDTSTTNDQPPAEQYSSNTYVKTTLNGTKTYKVVGATVDSFAGVILTPRKTDFSDWVLPNLATPLNIAGANVSPNLIYMGGSSRRAVGFLGRALFNGRELMTTRVMDIDVGMLRSQGNATATGGQPWLPTSGIVYAFREDALREDAIERPAGGTQTIATSNPGTDPALVTTPEGIQASIKQVDFIGDPDRRVHGFRLRNGSQVKRNESFGIPATDNIRGLTFVSDNPVYIQGDFNLHQDGNDDTAGTLLEEFTLKLNGTYGDFYKRTALDTKFARPATDRWRPSEILSDAVTLLSDNFCDGSMADTFLSTLSAASYHAATASTTNWLWAPGCAQGTAKSSFRVQNTPSGSATWLEEDGSTASTTDTSLSPIRVDRNGNYIKSDGTAYTGSFENFSTDRRGSTLSEALDNTRVNSIVVSGTVPFRANQGDGGLHNFPRFLENWNGKKLIFSGSFLQLNFSNYAASPFEQDAWEPGAAPSGSENLNYYWPPTRTWGYDPALQLAPAGPAAARFVTAGKARSEYYSEVSVKDPYMKKLCTSLNAAPKSGGLAGTPASIPCP